MTKFLIVKEQPKELHKNEIYIGKPNFFEEIAAHRSKAPRNSLTGVHHLRGIIDSIAQNYDPEGMNPFSVKVHQYEGRPFSNDEELSNILVEMMENSNPNIFTKYLDKKIKTRPTKTEMIYVTDYKIPFLYETFYNNGIIDQKQEERDQEKQQQAVEKAERSDKWKKQQETKKQKQEQALTQDHEEN